MGDSSCGGLGYDCAPGAPAGDTVIGGDGVLIVGLGRCSVLEGRSFRTPDATPPDVSEPDVLIGDKVLVNGALILRPPRLLLFAGTFNGATLGASRTGWTNGARPLAPFHAGRLSNGSGLGRPSCRTRCPNEGEALLVERWTWGPVMVVVNPRGGSSGVLDRTPAKGASLGASHVLVSARESGRWTGCCSLSLDILCLGLASLPASATSWFCLRRSRRIVGMLLLYCCCGGGVGCVWRGPRISSC